MELQQIKNLWSELDFETESTHRLNHILLKEVSVNKVKSLLSEFTLSTWLEHIINTIFLVLTIRYIVGHMYEVRFAAAALVLAVLFAYDVFWSVRHLYSIYTIDYDKSITAVQKKLESFLLYENKERKILFWAIPLFWVTFLIVGADAFLGLDLYRFPLFLFIQLIVSALFAPLVVLFLKLFPDRNMARANEFLLEIQEFEDE